MLPEQHTSATFKSRHLHTRAHCDVWVKRMDCALSLDHSWTPLWYLVVRMDSCQSHHSFAFILDSSFLWHQLFPNKWHILLTARGWVFWTTNQMMRTAQQELNGCRESNLKNGWHSWQSTYMLKTTCSTSLLQLFALVTEFSCTETTFAVHRGRFQSLWCTFLFLLQRKCFEGSGANWRMKWTSQSLTSLWITNNISCVQGCS